MTKHHTLQRRCLDGRPSPLLATVIRFGMGVVLIGGYLGAETLTPSIAFAQPAPPLPAGGSPGGDADEEIAKDASTEINVKNADIAAIVRIFSKKTKRNYILDERVKGKVSIYLPGRVSAEESLRILDSVLALKGFTSVPVGENLWKIVPSREARQTTIPTRTGPSEEERASAAVVTRLVNLRYVNAEDVQQILSQLVSADGLINAYTGTNSLIIIDSEDNIQRLVDLVAELDVPSTDRDMSIIPIKFADAVELSTKLNEILLDGGQGKDGQGVATDLLRNRSPENALAIPAGLNIPGQPPPGIQPPQRASSATVGKTVAARGKEPKIIPEERTNSIIVVADEETTARVKALISQLDTKVDLSGSKFYVYRCQYANAEELAQVLAGLAGGGSGTGTGSGTGGAFGGGNNQSGFGSGLNSNNAGFNGFGQQAGSNGSSTSRNSRSGLGQSRLQGQNRTPGQPRNNSSGTGAGSVQLGDNISVTADPATNSLIISASKTDYIKVKALLERIDVKRRQVLVEAMLLEVAIDDSLSLGTDFISSTGGADGGILARSEFGRSETNISTLLSNPQQIQQFSLAAASSGSLTLPGGLIIPTQSILLTAAQSNSNVNVLSAPTILATDNEQAEIVVGQNVPFLASTSTNQTNLNNTFNTIDRQDVGITLRLTPQISSGDFVNLQIFTEVSAVVAATLTSALGPTTTVRTSQTTAIAKDSQMIVIGGLMSDDVSESTAGIPFLKDIPVFGHLFNDRTEARSRKNLLIFITPRIVKDQYDFRDVTKEHTDPLSDQLHALDVFPDREDVLKDERIDRIAESSPFKGQKPGTILPPSNYGKSAPSRLGSSSDAVVLEDDVIDLTVSPQLPGQAPVSKGSLGLKAEPKPSTTTTTKTERIAPSAASRSTGDRYIVLETINPQVLADQTPPFALGTKNRLAAVVAPGESAKQLSSFFAVGREVGFDLGGETLRFRVAGSFEEAEDASDLYPTLPPTWYALSPYEIMSVGQGPWINTNGN